MQAVVKWSLWQRKWSLLWWSLGLVGMIALVVLLYPSFRNQASTLNQSVANLPQGAKALFTDTNDFFSPVGYMSSQIYYFTLPLLLSILSIGLGSSLLGKEEQDGTLELLLSRPISRSKLLLAKAASGLLVMLSVCFVTGASIVIFSEIISLGIPLPRLVLTMMLTTILTILFGSIAFMFSSLGGHGRGASMGLATLVAFLSYLISSLDGTVHWLRGPAEFLPFHYYRPAAVMNGNYTWAYAFWMIVTIGVLFAIAAIGFRYRDIKS